MITIISVLLLFSSYSTVWGDIKPSINVPMLTQAVLEENPELYSKEMERLLNNASIKEFNKTIQFTTNEGDTILHLMARKSHQEFYAKELKNLINAFFISIKGRSFRELSLGGYSISVPYLEDTVLGQAILDRNVFAIGHMLEQAQQSPIKEWIPIFQARARTGDGIANFAGSHLRTKDLKDIHRWGIDDVLDEYSKLLDFLYIKNDKGQIPLDLVSRDNTFAYYAIADAMSELNQSNKYKEANEMMLKLGMGAFGAAALGFVGSIDSATLGFAGLIGGGLFGYGLSSKCMTIFDKKYNNKPRFQLK
ncbi:MAG: hypothetical protein OXN83_01445 [Oligoflexia bacterium]|nr:hypothetical protein [Oligoflexia bacterium]